MKWIEYNIRKGEKNFTPSEPWLPGLAKGFEFWVAFHHSCYFSWADREFDGDWKDVMKLRMLTLAYTPNNHLSYGAGFMPANGFGYILTTPYTNYPGTDFQTRREDSVKVKTVGTLPEAQLEAGSMAYGRVTRNSRKVFYHFECGNEELNVSHDFRLKWWQPWISRLTGTWAGGANNSPGRYGGEASQDMKLWLNFNTI